MLNAIHHVQLAMPQGGEARARAFYDGLLGLAKVPKPAELARRGGVWFERGSVRVHLGVEDPFHPARKAHPAFLVDDLRGLRHTLEAAGQEVRPDGALRGYDRFYIDDPFGNRLELLEPTRDRALL